MQAFATIYEECVAASTLHLKAAGLKKRRKINDFRLCCTVFDDRIVSTSECCHYEVFGCPDARIGKRDCSSAASSLAPNLFPQGFNFKTQFIKSVDMYVNRPFSYPAALCLTLHKAFPEKRPPFYRHKCRPVCRIYRDSFCAKQHLRWFL